MPSTAIRPFALDKSRARRLWLCAQRLDAPVPFGDGPAATRAAVEHLGYVQIDTIHVVERCHHQILYTRIPGYRREHLHHAQAVDKSVFEYWTHALPYVPTRDYRFFVRDMNRHRREGHPWFARVTAGDLRKVLSRLRRTGPLTIRDIDDDVLVEKHHEWASRKPSKHALQLAFYRGVVTVSERKGMLKTYELADRHFGWQRPRAATEREILDYMLDRALRAQGIVSVGSASHLMPRKAGIRNLIAAQVRRNQLVAVDIGGVEHWVRPQTLETTLPENELVHILNPFDPMVIHRKRLQLFFGYEHRFEAYLPPKKRVFGYFSQPVLVGDRIAAVIDLKTDRERGKLLVRKWTWVGRPSGRKAIEEALHRFERFQLAR